MAPNVNAVAMALRDRRHSLCGQLFAAQSPREFFDLQVALATEISNAERQIAKRPSSEHRRLLKYHIKLIRLLGDGVVWRCVHPHAIRNLANHPGRPPSIWNQGEAFDRVLQAAESRVDARHGYVVIADITNIVHIGDFLLVRRPDVPIIVEVKTRLARHRLLTRGRIGRQISRAAHTTYYLENGAEATPKSGAIVSADKFAIVVSSEREHMWSELAEASEEALIREYSYRAVEPGRHLWCMKPGTIAMAAANLSFREIRDFENGMAIVGTSSDLKTDFRGLHAPPSAWDIPSNLAQSILEGDMVVMQAIRGDILDQHTDGLAIIRDHDIMTDLPFLLVTDSGSGRLSNRFVGDLLFGMETIGSVLRRMIELGWLALTYPERFLGDYQASPHIPDYGEFPNGASDSPKEDQVDDQATGAVQLRVSRSENYAEIEVDGCAPDA